MSRDYIIGHPDEGGSDDGSHYMSQQSAEKIRIDTSDPKTAATWRAIEHAQTAAVKMSPSKRGEDGPPCACGAPATWVGLCKSCAKSVTAALAGRSQPPTGASAGLAAPPPFNITVSLGLGNDSVRSVTALTNDPATAAALYNALLLGLRDGVDATNGRAEIAQP